MANEITVGCVLRCTNGAFSFNLSKTKQVTQSTIGGGGPGFVTIGTSEENISFGDGTPGYIFMQNLDSTNYVSFGMNDGGTIKKLIRLRAGEIALFPLESGTTIRAQANTASVNCYIAGLNA